jgi:hypothetical protein
MDNDGEWNCSFEFGGLVCWKKRNTNLADSI